MYNVISKETGEAIVVEVIDASKHLHISGTEFTTNQLAGLVTTKKAQKIEEVEEVVETQKAKKGK